MAQYKFNPAEAYADICDQWTAWANKVGAKRFVFGVSGGKDSTVIAYLAARIFGVKNCYGVMMPNGNQSDIKDSKYVVESLKIYGTEMNIRDAFVSVVAAVRYSENEIGAKVTETAKINLAPRLRMAMLYAVAQTVGGFVINTDNLSERLLGYFTVYGDGAGDYAPLRELTATEVVKLGEWLGVPDALIHKKPGDGLQELGDEDRFGFSYADFDHLIRTGEDPKGLREKVIARYKANRFKTDIVNIPGPKFETYPNFIVND